MPDGGPSVPAQATVILPLAEDFRRYRATTALEKQRSIKSGI